MVEEKNLKKKMIGIIGSGSWATAIAKILLEEGDQKVAWWVRSEDVCEGLRREGRNVRHLGEVLFDPARLIVDTDLAKVVSMCDTLFLAIPSAYLSGVMSQLLPEVLKGRRFVSLIKGSLPEKIQSVSMYMEEDLGVDHDKICVVSGPSHAEEVAKEMPTFLTIASHCPQLALDVEKMLHCSYIYTSHTTDIEGVERSGLAKNVYAIAAGLCQGLGYGDNMNAVLTAAAFREMSSLVQINLPCEKRDLTQPCYLGDLMVTCWSQHSRNRALGVAVALGKTVQEAFDNMGTVAEGYYSVRNIHLLAAKMEIETPPIAESVYRVLYEHADPRTEMQYMIDHVF